MNDYQIKVSLATELLKAFYRADNKMNEKRKVLTKFYKPYSFNERSQFYDLITSH
jgi:hypothetical protein